MWRRARAGAVIPVLFVLALVVAGCGSGKSSAASGGKLKLAASIPPVQQLVSAVAGDKADVTGIVPAGVDGHTYEPNPGDVKGLSDTSILFVPDKTLNPKVTALAEKNLAKDGKIVDLNALAIPKDQIIYTDVHSHGDAPSHGHEPNVHTWTNLPYGAGYVDKIADELIAIDVKNADTYRANRDKVKAEITALETATTTAMNTIPQKNRTMVVYHDSWSSFARTYGFKVQGALQAVDFAEPSAAEMRKMVTQVKGAGVPAFFGSEVFPTKVLDQVAAESGVKYEGNLSDDKLPGNPGDPDHTYVGMMRNNVKTIVTGLGGDPSAINGVTPKTSG